MVVHALRTVLLTSAVALVALASTAQAQATTSTVTNGAVTTLGTVTTTAKAGTFEVRTAAGKLAGRIVKHSSTTWFVYGPTKKLATVKKQSSAKKPCLAPWVARKQTGWVQARGSYWDWWVKYPPPGIMHGTPLVIDHACPGAPAAGAGVLLLSSGQ